MPKKNAIKYIPQREEMETAIAIYGITDRQTGKKPEIIKFKNAPDLYKGLGKYLQKGAMPTYEEVLEKIKADHYVKILKLDQGGKKFTYKW